MAIFKRSTVTNFDKTMEKVELTYVLGGDVKWQTTEDNYKSLTKLNLHLSYDPAILLLGFTKENNNVCPHKHSQASVQSRFIYHRQKPKQPKCPSTGK